MVTQLKIQGLVQGVGFRPFIYRIAKEMGIKGTIANCNDGVIICAKLTEEEQSYLVKRIQTECPEAAFIHQLNVLNIEEDHHYIDFTIEESFLESNEVTQVAPDIPVCSDCMNDRKTQKHRIGYPFINCTHCGPRFSIIKDLPYDRKMTTMSGFSLCADCEEEYKNVNDRRFHAQPIACNNCGPVYYGIYNGDECKDYNRLLTITVQYLNEGRIIAAKGVGGYHLICDAMNESAVKRLREIKVRDTKPFAVMFRDIESVKAYTYLNNIEEDNLKSWRRPIVLLKQRTTLALEVNPGMSTLGCMLPYMPIHYDWFKYLKTSVLVMTSGNLSDLPIAISPDEAERQLHGEVDFILHHNRSIHNRVDDSVMHICGNNPCLIRRSRGYVPEPFFADVNVEGLLAFGAEKVNTFVLGKGDTIIQSQYIGDLKNWETFQFYTESLARFRQLFRFEPKHLICDLHPDYMSSQEAQRISSETGVPLLKVQHHHAHAAACMLEYGLHNSVIAVIWDGIGLGDDERAWGGEFFLCDRKDYTRLSHLEYVPMPGGDKASSEPWRMAIAYLLHYNLPIPQSLIGRVGSDKIDMVKVMIKKGINAPYTSSAGRMFDAFSSLLGLCDVATHQAQAPILLEQSAAEDFTNIYLIDYNKNHISISSLLNGVLTDLEKGISINFIAAKIHNSLALLIFKKTKLLLEQTNTENVVLSGGCFQNKRLTEQLQVLFSQHNIPLYIPSKIPCNDSGISAGQIAIAAARISNSK